MRCHWKIASLTKAGNIEKPGLLLVLSWVKSAWDDIPEDMMKKVFLKLGLQMPWMGVGMINYWMTALMVEVIKLKRACHYHGMLMRMYQKKTGIDYLRTVNAVTLMVFNTLRAGVRYFRT